MNTIYGNIEIGIFIKFVNNIKPSKQKSKFNIYCKRYFHVGKNMVMPRYMYLLHFVTNLILENFLIYSPVWSDPLLTFSGRVMFIKYIKLSQVNNFCRGFIYCRLNCRKISASCTNAKFLTIFITTMVTNSIWYISKPT